MAGTVTVTLDRAALTARFKAGAEHAGPIVAEQIRTDCNLFSVPDDGEHTLKDSSRVEKDGDDYAVVWDTVYAPYQFYGVRADGSHVVKRHTQGYSAAPSTMWTESGRERFGDDWDTVMQREFVRGAGG